MRGRLALHILIIGVILVTVAPTRRATAGDSHPATGPALDWLCDHQSTDGHWSNFGDAAQAAAKANGRTGDYTTILDDGDSEHFRGWDRVDTGITALAVRALLAGGVRPFDDSRHGKALMAGIEWLIKSQADDGEIYSSNDEVGSARGYGHPIAMLALADALTASPDSTLADRLKTALKLAVKWSNAAQQTDGLNNGAWSYPDAGKPKISNNVSGWTMLALLAARDAKVPVDNAVITKGRDYLIGMTGIYHGYPKTGYLKRGGTASRLQSTNNYPIGESVSALNVLVQVRLDPANRRKPWVRAAAAALCNEYLKPSGGTQELQLWQDFMYWTVGAEAVYRMGKSYWDSWDDVLEMVAAKQRTGDAKNVNTGSFDPDGAWGVAGGRVFSTAMAVLLLQTPHRVTRNAYDPADDRLPWLPDDKPATATRLLEAAKPSLDLTMEKVMADPEGVLLDEFARIGGRARFCVRVSSIQVDAKGAGSLNYSAMSPGGYSNSGSIQWPDAGKFSLPKPESIQRGDMVEFLTGVCVWDGKIYFDPWACEASKLSNDQGVDNPRVRKASSTVVRAIDKLADLDGDKLEKELAKYRGKWWTIRAAGVRLAAPPQGIGSAGVLLELNPEDADVAAALPGIRKLELRDSMWAVEANRALAARKAFEVIIAVYDPDDELVDGCTLIQARNNGPMFMARVARVAR